MAGVSGVTHPFSIFVEVVGAIEILWYLAWFLPYRHYLQRPGIRPTPLRRAQRRQLFRKALDLITDGEQFVRKWMQNSHLEDIRRENLKDWFLWALWERDGPPGEDDEELEDIISEVEERLDMKIKPGRGDAEALRPSFDRIRMTHRSLFWYIVSASKEDVRAQVLLLKDVPMSSCPMHWLSLNTPN